MITQKQIHSFLSSLNPYKKQHFFDTNKSLSFSFGEEKWFLPEPWIMMMAAEVAAGGCGIADPMRRSACTEVYSGFRWRRRGCFRANVEVDSQLHFWPKGVVIDRVLYNRGDVIQLSTFRSTSMSCSLPIPLLLSWFKFTVDINW